MTASDVAILIGVGLVTIITPMFLIGPASQWPGSPLIVFWSFSGGAFLLSLWSE
jgi:hypothetical protein